LPILDEPVDVNAMMTDIDRLATSANPHWTPSHEALAVACSKKFEKKRKAMVEVAGEEYFAGGLR
jgi:hypothetical protein